MDGGGRNHIGLDFDPDVKRALGQVIRFGADEGVKQLLAASLDAFVEKPVDWLDHASRKGRSLEAGAAA